MFVSLNILILMLTSTRLKRKKRSCMCFMCSVLSYGVAKKYLISHQLCKFSYLKRSERPLIFISYTLTLRDRMGEESRKLHCILFNDVISKFFSKTSIWSPTNKLDLCLSQIFNLFMRLFCPPLNIYINGTCLNWLSV